MLKIETEYNASQKYNLETIFNGKLVALTLDNVARVESMIRNDSDYINSSDKSNITSSAYWMCELKKVLMVRESVLDEAYEVILRNCVKSVDRENSTHLESDGCGRNELTKRLVNIPKYQLLFYLKTPQDNDYELIKILSEETHPTNSGTKKYHPRKNYSFASKFCHYACFYLFEGAEEQDNFSIYDSIIGGKINDYAREFDVALPTDIRSNYSSFIKTVDSIIQKSGNHISRNGFDHLIWYFHKARKTKLGKPKTIQSRRKQNN